MPIAPITGTLKKRMIVDIGLAFVIGSAGASYWWWGFHQNAVETREAWYAAQAERRKAEE
ncbi:cytochrome c oxidase subunit VIIa [Ascoidea rubescens DSM 1968]|uniref:Cytochrome c oxidase subunit 9, mitochondrial n=1 Tax=Ascoidea rubescens DSM 1968 TaxID=1344418 RepID=A0A1D2VBL0_9ASCO|nr:cytochrome c oxidase subunit VIIa [Ascoidea rubescens DSM 1968]ODV59009.1 cytochrome c oxidase subunit VIIa [Ascoidea rubescens DSM 1968]